MLTENDLKPGTLIRYKILSSCAAGFRYRSLTILQPRFTGETAFVGELGVMYRATAGLLKDLNDNAAEVENAGRMEA